MSNEVNYNVGDIVFNKLSYKKNNPPKYFRATSFDKNWGVVGYKTKINTDTLGVSYVRKTNIFEKMLWLLFYSNK